MRRTAVRVTTTLALWVGAVLALIPATAAPAAADPVRYRDEIFPTVDVTSNVIYGQAVDNSGTTIDLKMDVYTPHGDTATDRPAMVWAHGGWFVAGDKSSMANDATYLAKRGWVAVSINYRLNPGAAWVGQSYDQLVNNPDFIATIYKAYADTRTAVAFLRTNAAGYGIDPERIATGGYSAGAVTALNTAFWPVRYKGEGTPADPGHIRAAVSLAGTTAPGFIEVGEAPVMMAHGSKDTTVAYSAGVNLCNAAPAKFVPCEFHTYNATHDLSAYWPEIRATYTDFLYRWVVAPAPRLETISPNQGFTTGGQTTTLTGSGFLGTTTVTFGGTASPAFTVNSDYSLTVTVPPGAGPVVNVKATNPNGTSTTNTRTLYAYVVPPTPAVTRVSPNRGPSTGGTVVTVTGSGFTGATGVSFGSGVPASSFTVDSDTTITAVAPPRTSALVNLAVTGPGGTSASVPWVSWYLVTS